MENNQSVKMKKAIIQTEIMSILFDFLNDRVLSEDIAEDIMISISEKLK